VLVRHGLADVVSTLRLGRYLGFGARWRGRYGRAVAAASRARRLRLAFEELGPTFVKFGQALSIRADVLPADLVAEFATLQDHVPPLEPGEAERVIEAEFGRPIAELFLEFDPAPLAAASIAQVHRAVLATGELVVVKVRRPGIARVMAGDVAILRQLAFLVERHLPGADIIDPPALVDEFARTLRAEQNFVREGRNLEHAARNFEGDPTVRIPAVYWDRTTPAVLTMDFLDGVKISALESAGLDGAERSGLARRGADAMLAQILVHGFFHADPHPGNVMVMPDGAIGLLDFGIVGRLDERTREDLARVIRAVSQRDLNRLTALAVRLTEPRREVDLVALERDLSELIDTYGDVPIGELSMSDVLGDAVDALARHSLRFPSNLLLLVKAIVTIEGVGRQLDPSFQIVEHAAPIAERLWIERHSPRVLAARVADATREAIDTAREIPVEVSAVMRKLRDNRFEVQFVHRNLEHFVTEMDRSSNRLSFAIVIGSLVVGSSLVIQAGFGPTAYGYSVLGLVGLAVAWMLGIGLAVGVLRSGRL
jgi:ubiquinone biosynthesis protein